MEPRPTSGADLDASVIAARLVPPGTTRVVTRPRLVDALDAASELPLTLLAAPAGAGKTILLADWLRSRNDQRVAWLTLDRANNDRRRFWADLTAALQRVLDPTRDPLAGLRPPPLGSFDGFVASFLNAAAATSDPVTIVLDDAQEIGSDAVLTDLDAMLEHGQPGLRLIVATRIDPPLRLQRLRMAGNVGEIRFHDLSFTREEAGQLLRQELPSTSPLDIDTLWAKTEGWAAGLRIAALTMREHPAGSGFAQEFAGDHRPILNYLIDEVFSGLPEETSSFLLATATLSRVSAPLADAVREAGDSADILDDLVRRNLLIAPVDTPEQWYRYHPLFVEALTLLQRRRIADQLPTLHRRAAAWHAANGSPLEAIEHAVRAEDWGLAGPLLVEHWLPLTISGDAAALRVIAARLPASVIHGDAEIALAVAGLELEAGDDQAADLLTVAAELAPNLTEDRRRPYEVALAMTMLFRSRSDGDPTSAVEAARRVLASRWDREMTAGLRALARTSLGIAELWIDDLDAAAADLATGQALADEAANDAIRTSSQGWAALVHVVQGRLIEAERSATAALLDAADHGWAADPHAAPAHVALATLALLWSDLDAAERHTADAVVALGRSGERNLRAWIAVVDARLRALRGEPETGLANLSRLTVCHDGQAPLPKRLQSALLSAEGRARVQLGEHDSAERLAMRLEDDGEPIGLAAAAAMRLAMHQPARALSLAERLTDHTSADPGVLVEAWSIKAIALDVQHDEAGAIEAMERALDLAEPRGYRRPLLDGGLRTALLLRRLIRHGTAHRALVEELLATIEGTTQHGRGREVAPLALSEPLSERELVVLRYMPTSMPYAEVATELFVSVNTVKTHVRHVYRKLDVDSRRDAVARAIELRLLSPSASAGATTPRPTLRSHTNRIAGGASR